MTNSTIIEAEQISDRITYQDISIGTGYSLDLIERKDRLMQNINLLTKSKANNDDKSLEYALKIIEDFRWLVVKGYIMEQQRLLGSYKRLAERFNKLADENNELRKDNAMLLEKYTKLEGKLEYCSEELDKIRGAFRGAVGT